MGIAATIWPGWTPAAPAPSRSTTPTRSHPGVKGTGCEQGERWTLPLPVTPRAASAVHALLRLAVPCARRVGVARGPVEVRRAAGRRRGQDALVQLAEAGIRGDPRRGASLASRGAELFSQRLRHDPDARGVAKVRVHDEPSCPPGDLPARRRSSGNRLAARLGTTPSPRPPATAAEVTSMLGAVSTTFAPRNALAHQLDAGCR